MILYDSWVASIGFDNLQLMNRIFLISNEYPSIPKNRGGRVRYPNWKVPQLFPQKFIRDNVTFVKEMQKFPLHFLTSPVSILRTKAKEAIELWRRCGETLSTQKENGQQNESVRELCKTKHSSMPVTCLNRL